MKIGSSLWVLSLAKAARVYASTNNITRHTLWMELTSLISSPLSTLLIGDFNEIVDADERTRSFDEDVWVLECREFIAARMG